MKIRPAGEADEAATIALWRACGLVVSHNDPAADFRFARGKSNSDVLLGADADGLIVASVMVGHDGHRGWLYYVAVSPAQRDQGLGAQILRAGEEWLEARGVPKVQLLVRETNSAVAAFYAKSGFETAPRILMQKWLKPPN
jgi:ribosomal protein S18 acetylase RimI-like enzyme